MKNGSKVIGYRSLLGFDDDAFILAFRTQELKRLKDAGKVWTRGEPIHNLSPTLREFIESQNGSPSMARDTMPNAQNEHFNERS